MIMMNTQPNFIPIINLYPQQVYPQFLPAMMGPIIPFNMFPQIPNPNFTPQLPQQNNDHSPLPPGLSGQDYQKEQPSNFSAFMKNVNFLFDGNTPSNYLFPQQCFEAPDSEFWSLSQVIFESVQNRKLSIEEEIWTQISIYNGGDIQPEDWEVFLLEVFDGDLSLYEDERRIFQQLFANLKGESRFLKYCENSHTYVEQEYSSDSKKEEMREENLGQGSENIEQEKVEVVNESVSVKENKVEFQEKQRELILKEFNQNLLNSMIKKIEGLLSTHSESREELKDSVSTNTNELAHEEFKKSMGIEEVDLQFENEGDQIQSFESDQKEKEDLDVKKDEGKYGGYEDPVMSCLNESMDKIVPKSVFQENFLEKNRPIEKNGKRNNKNSEHLFNIISSPEAVEEQKQQIVESNAKKSEKKNKKRRGKNRRGTGPAQEQNIQKEEKVENGSNSKRFSLKENNSKTENPDFSERESLKTNLSHSTASSSHNKNSKQECSALDILNYSATSMVKSRSQGWGPRDSFTTEFKPKGLGKESTKNEDGKKTASILDSKDEENLTPMEKRLRSIEKMFESLDDAGSNYDDFENKPVLSKCQKKKLRKKRRQQSLLLDNYYENTAPVIDEVDPNYLAMVSNILAEDQFCLSKLKEIVLAQNRTDDIADIGFTEEELLEIEEVNYELEKVIKRTSKLNCDDNDNKEENEGEIPNEDDEYSSELRLDKMTNEMKLFMPKGYDSGIGNHHDLDAIIDYPNVLESAMTTISSLEELMKNRADFYANMIGSVQGCGLWS